MFSRLRSQPTFTSHHLLWGFISICCSPSVRAAGTADCRQLASYSSVALELLLHQLNTTFYWGQLCLFPSQVKLYSMLQQIIYLNMTLRKQDYVNKIVSMKTKLNAFNACSSLSWRKKNACWQHKCKRLGKTSIKIQKDFICRLLHKILIHFKEIKM